MSDEAKKDLMAEAITAQVDELWRHIPPADQPPDDATVEIGLHDNGTVAVKWRGMVFLLAEGRAWRHRPVPLGEEIVEFENGRRLETKVVARPGTN